MEQSAKEYTATAKVAIIGAGSIGIEMAATLKRAGTGYIHLDASQM